MIEDGVGDGDEDEDDDERWLWLASESRAGYRDMERGAVTFLGFHEFLSDRAGYRGTARDFQAPWSNFFDGPMPGIEEVLERVSRKYRLAFLSTSN